jgi:energy-coupling factor transporter transmembrane protein EcfT
LAAVFTVSIVPPTLLPVAAGMPCSWIYVAIAAALLATIVAARVSWRPLMVRLALIAPMLLLVSISVPLAAGFRSGWFAMAAVLIKGLLSISVMLVLVQLAPFEHLLHALRQIGIPAVFVATLSFMYRYLFVLEEELARMRRARAARNFGGSRLSGLKLAVGLVGMLIVRSFERAERVHAAMLARGFNGDLRTLDELVASDQ